MRIRKRIIKYVNAMIYIIAACVLVVFFVIYSIQQKLFFYPEKLPLDYKYSFENTFKEKNYKIKESAIINALHFYADSSKGVIFYLHGNAGSLRTWGNVSGIFLLNNYDVLMIDYRSFGKSRGKLHEKALYSDAEYIYNELKKEYREKNIIIYGRSMGTGIAAYISSANEPGYLVLEAPYYNMLQLVRQYYPLFPGFLLRYKIPTNEFLKNVNCPVTIIHGTNDEVISYAQSVKLKEFLKEEDELITIKNGHHNDLIDHSAYISAINELLKD